MPLPTAGESGLDTSDFDLDAAINAVGAATEGAEPPAPSAEAGPAPAAPAAPVEEDIPLPKAWKKELEADWKLAPKSLREYVVKQREPDVQRGVQMYRDGHERWNKLLTPYQEILSQYPDVDPGALLNGLMQSHLKLTFGTPAEKREMTKQLLQAYQVQLEEDAAAAGVAPPAIPPELDSRIARLEADRAAEKRQQVMSQVETFFADPKNEYAKDVANEILTFVNKGHALHEAYNLAIWTNPEVRAKLVAKEQAEAATSAAKLNVGAAPDTPAPAPRKGSMEDTMQAVIRKHYTQTAL